MQDGKGITSDGVKVRKYFAKFPYWSIHLTWVATLFSLCSLNRTVIVTAVLLGALICGGMIISWRDKPGDDEIDRLLMDGLNLVSERSIDSNNLDESQICRAPVSVIGFSRLAGTGVFSGVRRGADGVLRYTPVDATVLHFTEDFLAVYSCSVDLEKMKLLGESAEQYYYEDIVSVSVRAESVALEKNRASKDMAKELGKDAAKVQGGKVQITDGRRFMLTTKAGTSISATLPSRSSEWVGGSDNELLRSADESARAVQKMLAEKKKKEVI